MGLEQGCRAAKLLSDGMTHGNWVILENCHVAESWLNDLEIIYTSSFNSDCVHDDYRLWCTTKPTEQFPIAMLQASIKITIEKPKGIKRTMLKSFSSEPLNNDKFYNQSFAGKTEKHWLRGVFTLVFFHAVLLERRTFDSLGWNIPYGFNDFDLKCSLVQLKTFLKQFSTIPFEAHSYLISECYYGGRVIDAQDRLLLKSLLKTFYKPECIDVDNYPLTECKNVQIPVFPNKANSIEAINNFRERPELLGLHGNADMGKNLRESNKV